MSPDETTVNNRFNVHNSSFTRHITCDSQRAFFIYRHRSDRFGMKTSIITWWSNLCHSWLGIPSNKECISSGNTSFLPSNINWLELTGFEWLLNRVIKLSVDTIKFNQNHTNITDYMLTRPHQIVVSSSSINKVFPIDPRPLQQDL
jgi:hypothetical protein